MLFHPAAVSRAPISFSFRLTLVFVLFGSPVRPTREVLFLPSADPETVLTARASPVLIPH
jgi:hypothetical protein